MRYCGDDNSICVIGDSVVSNIHPQEVEYILRPTTTMNLNQQVQFPPYFSFPCSAPIDHGGEHILHVAHRGASTATSAMTKLPYLYIG